ncbi:MULTISPECIES: TonB-dependent receptor [Myroides]|uniref:TonB-dependent receptor n=1 Tax=Myroides albus TaxID=2562892 RepID=A0A6I3LFY9_9FLAO|nr:MULTISPECIES: TonB-dependent receptor [Myroides]MTG97388.1 TonB-dependent receptor [Myroides albus]MVX35116.1 TonB-dependent receptor [Myroides sp. LoEW2-1]UVD79417.1 TonB-dependent receptor [Myroides albus]
MKNRNIYIAAASVILCSTVVQAQDQKKQDLGTEVVNVVRNYDATVSDASKVKDLPEAKQEGDMQKKNVIYTINSYPVESTFVPEKGEVAEVEKTSPLKAYNNYALGSFGNYSNLTGEVFLSYKLDKTSYIAGFAKHVSSQGGIKDLLLDDAFSKTSVSAFYGGQLKGFAWNTELGGSYQMSNWYGLPTEEVAFNRGDVTGIKERQRYKDIFVNANLEFDNSPFKNVEVKYDRFWDDFSSVENRFSIKPNIQTRIGYLSHAQLGVVLDYVSTEFKDRFNTGETNKNTHFNIGFEPNVIFKDENYFLQVGLGIYYNDGKVNNSSDNKFYVYPQIKGSYNLVKDLLITYAGIEGGLQQNSFKELVGVNPFVAPDLLITPTDKKYDIYVGLRGKLDHNISYNVKGSYKNESDKLLFVHTPYSTNTAKVAYGLGNSFMTEAQKVKTFSLFGELKYEFSQETSIGAYGQWNNYDTNGIKPWNLPKMKFGANVDVAFDPQWYANVDLYYVGKRYDAFSISDIDANIVGDMEAIQMQQVRELEGYVDLNLSVGYRITKNWTAFVKANNILNDKYDKWDNFQVQGFQVMGGAIYKFDF